MDTLRDVFKKSGWISILVSLAFTILGIIVISNPQAALNGVAIIIGVLFKVEHTK